VVNRYIEAIGEKCISLDNVLGAYLATKHLIDLGHTQIAYAAGALFKADGFNRLLGHKKALEEANFYFDEESVAEGNFQAFSGEKCVDELFSRNVSFSAIACANDEMASGAINSLRKHGKRVPEDISVIGFDNVDFASYLTPKLTTVNYPVREIGAMASRWILNQAYGDGKLTMEHILSPKLIIRGTTRKFE
jgi:LacI family transcriptional regulator